MKLSRGVACSPAVTWPVVKQEVQGVGLSVLCGSSPLQGQNLGASRSVKSESLCRIGPGGDAVTKLSPGTTMRRSLGRGGWRLPRFERIR